MVSTVTRTVIEHHHLRDKLPIFIHFDLIKIQSTTSIERFRMKVPTSK